MKQYEHLKPWTMPRYYSGEVWPGYFVFLGQNRESKSLERSNFICGLAAIGGESDTVRIVRERHFACGWVEWIAIHQDDVAAADKAENILARLEQYPIVNETHWLELEWDEACKYWASMSVRDRAEYCAESGISIFAARRDSMPEDCNGYLYEILTRE